VKTPFNLEQFLDVFARYNTALWPVQIILNLSALIALALVFTQYRNKDIIITCILASLVAWTGIVYHLLYFTAINKAAYLFGTLFILQSLFFLYGGIQKKLFHFNYKADLVHWIGLLFILYGLLVYPIAGYFSGHRYPSCPTFGLPCPTTIFVFGMLLLSEKRIPFAYVIIPLLWSLIGFLAALSFGIYEDTGLLVAGVAGTTLILLRNRKTALKR
jgi:hypothetical protein